MAALGVDPNAFIRPSPTSGSLGGVARATRESIVVVEAAGYDVVLVETVGVGQSETMVADMVDMFVVLMLPNAGDSLQGIKKGILELADLVAVNKSDLDPRRAELAAREYSDALHLLMPRSETWTPPVRTVSAHTGDGLGELWGMVELHRSKHEATGELAERRKEQRLHWMWSMVDDRLRARLHASEVVQALLPDVETAVAADAMTPTAAADALLARFLA
jgi:LAO/AO transport system kinase